MTYKKIIQVLLLPLKVYSKSASGQSATTDFRILATQDVLIRSNH